MRMGGGSENMTKKVDLMAHINERTGWKEITPGALVYGSGNSEHFNTGVWRTATPFWDAKRCKQCLLCYAVCPDSSIPVKDGRRLDFDYDHCKGCGICVKVCPFKAIVLKTDGEEEKL
jgi:pyruvate ferredoxin oxidoreductase delta subunit